MFLWQIIFADECTEAEGQCFHLKHFACFECDALLGGERYLMRDSRPYCCGCFDNLYSECCEECGGRIGVNEGQMTHLGRHWHATEQCFACSTCRRSLLGRPLVPHRSRLYCSASCKVSGNPQVIDQDSKKYCELLERLDEEDVESIQGFSEQRDFTWSETRRLATSLDSTDGSQTADSSESSAYVNIDEVHLTELSMACSSSVDRHRHLMPSDSVSHKNRLKLADAQKNDGIMRVQWNPDKPVSSAQNVVKNVCPSSRANHKICATDYMLYPERHHLKQTERLLREKKCSHDPQNPPSCALTNSHSPKFYSKQTTVHKFSPAYSYGQIVASGNVVGVAENGIPQSVLNTVGIGSEKLHRNSREIQWQQQQENVYEEMTDDCCAYSGSSMFNSLSQTSSLPNLLADGVQHPDKELNTEQISSRMSDAMYLSGNESRIPADFSLNQRNKPNNNHRMSSCHSDGALKLRVQESTEKTEREASSNNSDTPNLCVRKTSIQGNNANQHLNLSPPVCNRLPPLPPQRLSGYRALVAGKQMTQEQVMAQYSTVQSEWERCSTCSSSSDSDFDYYLDRQSSGLQGNQSSNSEVHEAGGSSLQSPMPSWHKVRRKNHGNKHCIIS